MIVLGIETSTRVSSVALGTRDGLLGGRVLATGRGHVEFLMPAIRSLCGETGTELARVGGVAVGIGPGLFTGMRVGIQTAKTIAQMLVVPLVGIPSLDLLAFGVRYHPGLICASIDAKRGEVYAALYRPVPGGVERVSDHAAWKPEALAADLEARRENALLVGDGAAAYREVLATVERLRIASVWRRTPTADALLELAIPRFEREEHTTPVRLEPLYVRKSDAEITWEERGVVIERPFRVRVSKRAQGGVG